MFGSAGEGSTSRLLATEQTKSAVTDHAITLNHVIDFDQAKNIERKSNKMDRWIKEVTPNRKRQDKLRVRACERLLHYHVLHCMPGI